MNTTKTNKSLQHFLYEIDEYEQMLYEVMPNIENPERHNKMTHVFMFLHIARTILSECKDEEYGKISETLWDLSKRVLKFDEDLRNSLTIPITTLKYDWIIDEIHRYIR